MYLVLRGLAPSIVHGTCEGFSCYASDDIKKVAEAMEKGAIVYKLDSLTRVTSIDVTYKEVL